jgi:hypothetical protein
LRSNYSVSVVSCSWSIFFQVKKPCRYPKLRLLESRKINVQQLLLE